MFATCMLRLADDVSVGQNDIIPFDTVYQGDASYADLTEGCFVAKVAGWYEIHGKIRYDNLDGYDPSFPTLVWGFRVNGTRVLWSRREYIFSDNENVELVGYAMLQLNADDIVTFQTVGSSFYFPLDVTASSSDGEPVSWVSLNLVHSGSQGSSVPTGSLLLFAGDSLAVPSGFLLCEGQAVSRSTYADLFAVIGETYGNGDGSTTFNLPQATPLMQLIIKV